MVGDHERAHSQGASYREIASSLGVKFHTLMSWRGQEQQRGSRSSALVPVHRGVLRGAPWHSRYRGELRLDERVSFDAIDRVPHAPETTRNLERGWMTLEELGAAIVTVSDNPAANLITDEFELD